MRFITYIAVLTLGGSVVLTLPLDAAERGGETSKAQAMFVLDASGSMWGTVDGRSKIVIARDVLRDLLREWDPHVAVGLTVYGHRRKGDCNDIEVVVPSSPAGHEKIPMAIEQLRPMGKTPLSQAVREAAEALKYTEAQATVILISDGQETCGLDPCEVGQHLEQLGVDFTAHVIGFGVQPSEEAGLRCLAEQTGGRYVPAREARALRGAVVQVTSQLRARAGRESSDWAAVRRSEIVANGAYGAWAGTWIITSVSGVPVSLPLYISGTEGQMTGIYGEPGRESVIKGVVKRQGWVLDGAFYWRGRDPEGNPTAENGTIMLTMQPDGHSFTAEWAGSLSQGTWTGRRWQNSGKHIGPRGPQGDRKAIPR